MRIKSFSSLILFLLVVVVFYYLQHQQEGASSNTKNNITPIVSVLSNNGEAVLGVRTKTSNCHANGALTDPRCSPGAFDSTLTKEVICSSSFSTKSVRNVPAQEKSDVYAEYGILSHKPGEYEVDHIIPIELGGSNDIANLWPEPAEPRPGFHEKDVVENFLHKEVCDGRISLAEAQLKIATNWLEVYQVISQK